jgi:outer membrane protein
MIIFLLPAFSFCAEVSDALKITQASKTVSRDENAPLTLKDCYKLALKQSELIAVDSEKIKEAKAHFLEAFGTLLPQVSFSRLDTRQNSESSPWYNKAFEQKFVLTQTLFSGFKEFAAIAAGKFESKQRENEKLRAEQLLFVDVSDAFYLLMEEQEDLKALEAIRSVFASRINELKNRENLGKSRASEVVSTETQLYTLEDQIELVKSQEKVARDLLEFLIGRSVNETTDLDLKFSLKPESEYLAKASSRADVQAANFAWQLDQKGITVAKSGFFPQINLEADYFPHRSMLLPPTDSSWEALLTVNVPIFEGTVTYGQVKEAIAKAKESELLFKRAGRSAVQDIHDAYVNAQADLLRTGILEKALKSAEKDYELELQDYRLNVVNNLSVLTAIQNWENVRRSFIHILYESKRFYWQLLIAAGEINLE